MIQHTHYDRKLRKIVRTMVPETKEHTNYVKKALSSATHDRKESPVDYQRRVGRAYNE